MDRENFFKVYPNSTEEDFSKHSEYIRFMYNESNIFNCSECPENTGCNNCKLPCGQQNCWVAVHTEEDSEEDEE